MLSSKKPYKLKISIIIPTYNRWSYIKECLKSINAQKYKNYEIIVIDDASTEDIKQVKNYCDKYIRNEINLGPAYSRNLGVLNSKGEILLFLDSDTKLLQGTLGRLHKIFENDDSIGAVGGSGPPNSSGKDVEYITGKFYSYFGRSKSIRYYPQKESKDRLYDCDHIEGAFLAVRRAIFEKIGGFDPYWFYIGEDRELCLNVKELGYNVVASWSTRAMHTSLHSLSLNENETLRFALYRCFQVAIKRGSIFGGLRWLIGNSNAVLRYADLSFISKQFMNFRQLTNRKKTNFLDKLELDKYYSAKLAESLNNQLPFSITFPLPTPENIIIFITSRCNAACEHCFINSSKLKDGELKKYELKKIIDSLNQPANISLTGGEPFLRNDLKKIIEILMQSPKVNIVSIPSNGSLPKKIDSVCREICSQYKKPLNLQLSIDGMAEIHDNIRRIKGGFSKVIETCRRAKQITLKYPHFSFIVAITVMSKNTAEIGRLVDYLEKEGIPSKISIVRGNSFSTFDVPKDILDKNYGPADDCLQIDINKIKWLLDKISYKHPSYFSEYQKQKLKIMVDTLRFRKRQIPCYAGYKDVVIFNDGSVALCEQIKPFGKLSEWNWNFFEAWNSREAWGYRKSVTKCCCIHGCNISSSIMQKLKRQ